MNKKKLLSLLVITMGIVLGAVAVLTITGVLAVFTEPLAGPEPGFDEPATEDSTGKLQEIIGTSNAVTTGTTNLFDYLRQIDANEGGTPQAIAEDQTDEGKLQDLLGESAQAADGKTVFNYLKKVDENLPSGGPICGAGFTNIGNYCIQTDLANSGDGVAWATASDYCHDNYSGARLCSDSEWYNACNNNVFSTPDPGDGEWIETRSGSSAEVCGANSMCWYCLTTGCSSIRTFRCCK